MRKWRAEWCAAAEKAQQAAVRGPGQWPCGVHVRLPFAALFASRGILYSTQAAGGGTV